MEHSPSTSAPSEDRQPTLNESIPLRRHKKEAMTSDEKTVVVLKSKDIQNKDGPVLMANTSKVATFNNVQISSNMSQTDITEMLTDLFPYLKRRRFYCASSTGKKAILEFHGKCRIWDGPFILQKIAGNRTLYIFTDEITTADAAGGVTDRGYSSAAIFTSQPDLQEIQTVIEDNWGPVEGGTPVKIYNLLVDNSVQKVLALFGKKRVEMNRAPNSNCFLGLTPRGDREETVPVVVLTLDSVEVGRTEFTYMDETEHAFQVILGGDRKRWAALFDEVAQQETESQDIALNKQNSDLLGLPQHVRQLKSVEILRRLLYTAARIGQEKFVRMIFGTSAGRTVFEAYKNKSPLPENVADANGHEKIAAYLRSITESDKVEAIVRASGACTLKDHLELYSFLGLAQNYVRFIPKLRDRKLLFSRVDDTSQKHSKVVNWLELVTAIKESKELSSSKVKVEEEERDDILEMAHFGDVDASKGSVREENESPMNHGTCNESESCPVGEGCLSCDLPQIWGAEDLHHQELHPAKEGDFDADKTHQRGIWRKTLDNVKDFFQNKVKESIATGFKTVSHNKSNVRPVPLVIAFDTDTQSGAPPTASGRWSEMVITTQDKGENEDRIKHEKGTLGVARLFTTAFLTLVLLLLLSKVPLFGKPFPCKAGQIHWKPNSTSGEQCKCLECPYCFKGQEPSVPCGSSVPYKTPVDCVECQSGKTYSDGDGKEQCKACRMCSGKAIKKICTVSSNTECDDKCLPGYYEEPFIFGCRPCTDCCNDEKDEIAEECANSEKECKVRSTPCSTESKRSNTSETVRLKVSTTSPTTYKKPITSDPTWLESKPEKHTSNVLPTLSGNNLVVNFQTKTARSHNQNTNGNDNNVLIIACTVFAAFATLGIIVLISFKLCRRINADTVLAHCNRNLNDDSAVDDIELGRPLTSASLEQLHEDDMTLTELESNNQGVFDEMCLMLDNGRQSVSRDYERLAACYKGISLEVRSALQSEHLSNRSPSKMLMNHLETKYPNLPLRHFVWTLKEIGRNDLVEKLKPYVKKNVDSPPA